MMTKDELRSMAVRVDKGSGVLMRPLSNEHSYVFTAWHVVEQKPVDEIAVIFNESCGPLKGVKAQVKSVVKDEAMDAAILVIDKLEVEIPFVGFCNFNSVMSECKHLDYPQCRKDASGHIECAEHRVVSVKGTVLGGFVEYEYDKQVAKHELEGASGGGIFDDKGRLIGIHKQSAYNDDKEFLGAAWLIPSQVYVELLAANDLAPILKYDLTSFNAFADAIFNFSDNKALKNKLKGVLSDLAMVKPELLSVNAERVYGGFQKLRGGERRIDPQHVEKEDWVAFGEFLLTMKLMMDISLGDGSVEDIAKEYQYAHIGEDMDLYDIREKIDLKLLGKLLPHQKVVVGGIKDQGFDYDILRGDGSIPNIARAATSEGFDIATSGRDILDKFTFVNAHVFYAALVHFAPLLETIENKRLEFYCNKIKEACDGVENV